MKTKKLAFFGFLLGSLNVPLGLEARETAVTGMYHSVQAEVSGTVTDQSGVPLSGVTVRVKDMQTSTQTDDEGRYLLRSVPANSTLVFSYVSFVTQEVRATAGTTTYNVQLQLDEPQIGEVVVTALGIKREARTLGYATATVGGEDLSVNRTSNPVGSLQGKMAGVNISTMSTGPGGTSKIRIRGQSSFSGHNSPLIVVDGVLINNQNYAIGGNFGDRGFNNSDGGDGMSSINPDDIETLTVLKGATAAALYGSRAKDGVVMITTKSRGEGRGLGLQYNANFTTETPLDFTDFQY